MVPPLVSHRHQNIGAGFLRGFERPQREIAVGVVAVEEMLGVVDHFLAVLLQIAHGIGDELQIFFFGDPERAMDVQIPALAEDRDDRRAGFDQRVDAGVFLHRVRAKRVAPNATSRACFSFRSRARAKNSLSFGFEPGQPPSM